MSTSTTTFNEGITDVFLASIGVLEGFYLAVNYAPDLEQGFYYKHLEPGKASYNAQCGDQIEDEINYITEEYPQAKEYAVQRWIKSEASCEGV